MSVIEIVGGVILLIASLVIVFLTLMQHTHGQGLSGAINGSMGGASNARLTPADQMLAKTTRIAGIVFFVVAILACLFAGRLALPCGLTIKLLRFVQPARLRKERGCMDIESGEVKLILDEDGHCIDVKKRTSGESEAMIEEFMLLANQCAAHFARVKQIPFVYRVHEEPNAEKLERLHTLLQACGINDHFAKDVPTPKELSAILEGVRGGPYEQIINTGMLRCMSKAVYEEKPKGHYGLVLKDYAHFTSPIRRYPDLAIHRIMTAQLKGMDKDTMVLRYSDFAEKASKQSSEREIIAMQIERKAEDCYKAEYARRHLGECYEGRISGVTQRGLFIELDNGVEGFVPASSLTPSGTMLTEGIRLSDPVSGKNWSLGDTMMITIVRADVNLGKIDFEVAPASAK